VLYLSYGGIFFGPIIQVGNTYDFSHVETAAGFKGNYKSCTLWDPLLEISSFSPRRKDSSVVYAHNPG